ncbi:MULTISPECIES: FidL-like protein [Providencia]|uniref:FidL-like protein n=1 Tax=Providencia TaxID=586 RepID=UPI001B38F65B|nr:MULTISPECIES: FidL-like protein [Providencia]MBQ0368702.1 hypothetical protein [Providencia rettgeri]
MKKYLVASLVLIAAASTASFMIKKNSHSIQICHSEILWIKDNNTQDGLSLKSKVNIQLSANQQGRMNMYGYLKDNNQIYRLDRALYFDYQDVDHKGNYAVTFSSTSVTSSDNIPEKLFSNFIQLEKDKIKYYVNITKMDDNIYIIKDESYSAFTCQIQ